MFRSGVARTLEFVEKSAFRSLRATAGSAAISYCMSPNELRLPRRYDTSVFAPRNDGSRGSSTSPNVRATHRRLYRRQDPTKRPFGTASPRLPLDNRKAAAICSQRPCLYLTRCVVLVPSGERLHEVFQVNHDVSGFLVPFGRVLLEAPINDAVEQQRHLRIDI